MHNLYLCSLLHIMPVICDPKEFFCCHCQVQNVERAPDDYICLSLFMMFFCCPIGVAALCKSFSVSTENYAGVFVN